MYRTLPNDVLDSNLRQFIFNCIYILFSGGRYCVCQSRVTFLGGVCIPIDNVFKYWETKSLSVVQI